MRNTKITIENISATGSPFFGAYKKIFDILEQDSIFCERFETDESIGRVGTTYFLEIDGTIDAAEEEAISKLKNVTITQS
jgi:hypothetical protein|tara:strand:- start:1035 stop:1274 length:240 start_codon:yes stop_codon:yes gene_type:complete